MSLENAINTHAAALTELAAAIRDSAAAQREGNTGYRDAVVAYATASGALLTVATGQGSTGVKPDADLDKAVGKVEDDHKAKAAAAVKKAKADAAAKKDAAEAASAAASQSNGADSSGDDDGLDDGLDDTVLDYKADVRPVLLEAIKRTDKAQVQALVKSYGVDKAENLGPADFAEIVAKAKALGA